MTPARQLAYAVKLLGKIFALKVVQLILTGIILAITLPAVFFYIVRPKPATQINYGINFSQKYVTELGLDWKKSYIQILDDLKPKYARLVVYWDISEPQVGKYNYSDILWQLDKARKRNVKVILTMGRRVLRYPECHEPSWWKNSTDEKFKEEALLKYIGNTTNQLKVYDNIIMWQVENEPMFPFGDCQKQTKETVEKEIALVKSLDTRPILVQDSGEGGFWRPIYLMGDYLGISMYRRTWFNFWKEAVGTSFYVEYPLAHWTYKIKSVLTGVPADKIIVTELQGEPWGPDINSKLTEEEKQKTMSKQQFIETISYAQKSGFKDLYFWGVEWWLWEKEVNNNPFYWETAKAIIQN
ncbi:MAG: hypothetical protein WC988_00720 [Patescibacteria group bacterium]